MDTSTRTALTEQLTRAREDAERIANSFKVDEKGRFTISTEQHKDYVTAVRQAEEVKGLLDAADKMTDISGYLDAPEATPEAARDFGQRQMGNDEAKDLGSMFIESDAYRAAAERGFQGSEPIRLHVGIEGKSIYNFAGGSVSHQALGGVENRGIYERAMRKTHIRDLFPKSTTKQSVLYGVRETGWVNNAAQVNQRYAADGVSPATGGPTDVWGNAPKSKITLAPVLFPVAGIKHSIDAHKYILADEPRLRTFLNTRMLDGIKYAEDYDLLHSVGSGEKIAGLFNTTGVQTYTGLSSDQYSVQVRRAVTRALLAEYEPTGLVISPTMWEKVELEEDNQGAFRVAVSVAIGAEKRVWRLNVVETTAIEDSKFIVGAFGMGAQLHDREAVSVSASSEHANNYTEGIVTILAEERLALEISRPEAFCIGTWTTPV